MKKYNKPIIDIDFIVMNDIILTSGQGEINGSKPADEIIVFPGTHTPGN